MQFKAEQPPIPTDYLAPFESFKAYAIRRGRVYRGTIRSDAAADREKLEETLAAAPGESLLEEHNGRLVATIRVYNGRRPSKRYWLHALLLVLAFITTIGAGAEMARSEHRGLALIPFEFVVNSLAHILEGARAEFVRELLPAFLQDVRNGLPYGVSVMLILLCHEMGHYLMARRYKIDTTLPFVIPAPFFFGTMGAIIRMRSPIMHRRALFDVGAAGPLAGMVASLGVCIVGLHLSEFVRSPAVARGEVFILGNSPLFAVLTWLVHGTVDFQLDLHPMAVAGWFGFFVTFLNLLPLGQLDGGHVWFAVFGRAQHIVGRAFLVVMVTTGLLGLAASLNLLPPDLLATFNLTPADLQWCFPWLFFSLLVVTLLKVRHPPVVDPTVRVGALRTVLGLILIALFFLLITPRPITVVSFVR
jgi:membrane-associated protease RseP (regulator of RpoE activity)